MQSKTFSVPTHAREEMVDITSSVEEALRAMNTSEGICTIYTPHTTAAVTINENADPDVPSDLLNAFRAMVPKIRFEHAEGNSDAHLLSSIIGCSVQAPFKDGRLLLGRWQGVFFVELDGPRRRDVTVYVP
ncbi:MAG: secondary thiamine-phosphate synthase enzyme YjbQ [Thermoanaerobaculia bacterium]